MALVLPSDWGTYGANQKINWFNENQVDVDTLLGQGVDQASIDWMLANGYLGTYAPPAPPPVPPSAPATLRVPTYNTLASEQSLEDSYDPYAASQQDLLSIVGGQADQQTTAPSPAPVAQPTDWKSALQATKPGWTLQTQQSMPASVETGEGPGPIEGYYFYDPTQTAVGQQYQRYSPTGELLGTGQFKEVGGVGDLLKTAATDLGPILQFTPLAPLVQAVNAVSAIESGNIAGGIASLAGAATGANLGDFSKIANAANTVAAIQNKDPLAALAAGMNLTGTQDIGSVTSKEITAANSVVQGLQSGNIAQAINGAAQLTDSPNLALAGAAVNMVNAAQSGNPAGMLKAGEALSSAINSAQNQAAINQAYQDPSRALDVVSGTTSPSTSLGISWLADQPQTKLGMAEQESSTWFNPVKTQDLTTQDLADIVKPPGQVATAVPAVQTTLPTTAAATTTTTTAPTQGPYDKYVDFGEAFRAARSELGSGKQFTWTNPVTGATQTYTTDLAPTQVAQVSAGAGRGIAPGATAADAAALSKIPLRQEPAASTAQAATVADEPVYDALGNLVGGSTISGEAPAWFDPANKVLSNVVQQGFSNLMQAAGGQAKDFGGAAAALGIAGPNNALIRAGSSMENAGQGIELQSVKEATNNVITAVRDAEGWGGKLIAGVKAVIDNPSSANVAAREVFQEILPIGAASRAAKTIGVLAAAGVDTALNATESMGSSYNDSYAKAIKDGKTPEQADSIATKDGFIAGAITTLVGGAVDLAVVKKFSDAVEKAAGRVATSSGKEFGSESGEEFLIAVATGDDLNTALTKSVIGGMVGAKTAADIDVSTQIDAALQQELTNAGLSVSKDENGKLTISEQSTAKAEPSASAKTEPSFDPNAVVATDPDTGDAITLGELTGSTLSSAGTSTRIDPTLEALEGSELDSQQIINDYVNEVLGGNAPSVSASTANVVVGTDPETGADVTLGDLGLTGPTTKAPVTTGVTAPATTAPATTAPATMAAETPVAVDAEGNTLTAADVGAASSTASTSPSVTTAPSTTTAPDTAIASDTSVAAAPAATVGTDTKTTTDPNTGATTTTATDPNTGTETTTTTDPNTGTETNTATDPNTGSTTTTQTDPNANTSTTTKTDPNTNTSTSTTTDANTNTSTTTNTDANTNTTTSVETNQNTGVTTNTSTTPDTNTTTTTDPNTNTTTTTETNTDTGTSTTTTVDTITGKVVDTNVDEPPVLPPGEDVLPPVTEEELRTIVAGPPPAPTPAPPAPTPAPPAPAVKAPTPSPSPAAQLAQIPGMTPELANFIQELMQTEEADLLQLTTALKEERKQKRKDVRDKLKSRKA